MEIGSYEGGIMKKITIFLSIFLFSSILFEVHSADMNTIKGLSCSYVTNHHFTIDPKKTMDDMVRGSGIQKSKLNLIITDIDLSKGKAKMVGINDTVDVQVMRNTMGLIFIEITHSAIHTYVVYDTKTLGMGESDFPTIQSRNLFILGNGMSSQLAGMCVAVFRQPLG